MGIYNRFYCIYIIYFFPFVHVSESFLTTCIITILTFIASFKFYYLSLFSVVFAFCMYLHIYFCTFHSFFSLLLNLQLEPCNQSHTHKSYNNIDKFFYLHIEVSYKGSYKLSSRDKMAKAARLWKMILYFLNKPHINYTWLVCCMPR